MGYEAELEGSENLKLMLSKLPERLRMRWLTKKFEIKKTRRPSMVDIIDFVDRAAKEMADPVFGDLAGRVNYSVDNSKKPIKHSKSIVKNIPVPYNHKIASMAHVDTSRSNKQPCFNCKGPHVIVKCDLFKALMVADRVALVQSKNV